MKRCFSFLVKLFIFGVNMYKSKISTVLQILLSSFGKIMQFIVFVRLVLVYYNLNLVFGAI